MSYKSNIINNNYFSPLKILKTKNFTKSQHNIFTSSEKKKKSLEKSQDFLSNTIKKSNEDEYEKINKRKGTIKKIDEVILLLSQRKVIKEVQKGPNNKNNHNFHKYLQENSKKRKYFEQKKKMKI